MGVNLPASLICDFLLVTNSDLTRSFSSSAKVGWERCGRRTIHACIATSRSKSLRRSFRDRFEREAKAIAALNHPNICQIYDVGPNYLVMEYIEGTPLTGSLPPIRRCATRCRSAMRSTPRTRRTSRIAT